MTRVPGSVATEPQVSWSWADHRPAGCRGAQRHAALAHPPGGGLCASIPVPNHEVVSAKTGNRGCHKQKGCQCFDVASSRPSCRQWFLPRSPGSQWLIKACFSAWSAIPAAIAVRVGPGIWRKPASMYEWRSVRGPTRCDVRQGHRRALWVAMSGCTTALPSRVMCRPRRSGASWRTRDVGADWQSRACQSARPGWRWKAWRRRPTTLSGSIRQAARNSTHGRAVVIWSETALASMRAAVTAIIRPRSARWQACRRS